MIIPSKRRIATLISLIGEVKGRVELQKIIFILQNEGVDFDMMYSYNVYGPFSEDLQIEIDSLCSNQEGIISEDKPENQSYRTYTLKTKGKTIANDALVLKSENLVKFLGSLDREELELISSIYYFKNLDYNDEMVISKISKLKSQIFYGFTNAYNKYLQIKAMNKDSFQLALS